MAWRSYGACDGIRRLLSDSDTEFSRQLVPPKGGFDPAATSITAGRLHQGGGSGVGSGSSLSGRLSASSLSIEREESGRSCTAGGGKERAQPPSVYNAAATQVTSVRALLYGGLYGGLYER